MSVYLWTSDGFRAEGVGEPTYSLGKFRKIRKQVALLRHGPGVTEAIAYFRDENEARAFCDDMGLDIHWHCHKPGRNVLCPTCGEPAALIYD